ncbi:uncharacterized protein LOC141781906 [Sebastes fasciatus]|uniref:uncharacterized protein LOC141781906 n=1 Tax=Sebastes fasciatus TaxID=394691 RepID=UPI003D9E57ED
MTDCIYTRTMDQQQVYEDLTAISYQQLSAELQAERDQSYYLQLQLASLEVDRSCEEEQVKHLKNEVLRLMLLTGSLQQQVDNTALLQWENSNLQDENSTLQDQLLVQTGSLQQQVENTTLLHEENGTLQGENSTLREENRILQEKLTQNNTEVFRQINQNEFLQKQVDDLNKLLEENDSTLQKDIRTLQDENTTLQDQVLVQTGSLQKQAEKTTLLQQENNTLQKENRFLQEQNHNLQEEVLVQMRSLQKKVEKTTLLQEENNTLQDEVMDLTVAHKTSLGKLQALKELNQGLRTELEDPIDL